MATLSLTPDYVYEEETDFRVSISRFENDVEQRRLKHATALRGFLLRYVNRSLVDMNIMRDFYIARQGQFGSFTWNNPLDSTSYTVRFADVINISRKAYSAYDFEVLLKTLVNE